MKAVTFLLWGILLLCGTVSCLDSEDPLYVSENAYMLQVNSGAVHSFAPYVAVRSIYGDPLKSVTVKGRKQDLAAALVDAYTFQTNIRLGTLASANDLYTVNVESTDGRTKTMEVYFNLYEDDTLGRLNVTRFDYDSTGITIVCDPVTNATHYGVALGVDSRTYGYSRAYHIYYTNLAEKLELEVDGRKVIRIRIQPHTIPDLNTADILRTRVLPVVYNDSPRGRILLEGDYKLIEPGRIGFVNTVEP